MLARTVLLLSTLLACYAQTTPTTGLNFYDLEKERALGAELSTAARRQATVVENPTIQAYVDRIGQRLAAAIPNAPFPYQFTIVQDPPGAAPIEPVAFPAGYIFVPLSLIRDAKDEDEFAGLLAHAMSHIVMRHATRLQTSSQIADLANIPLVFMGGGWANYGVGQASARYVPMSALVFQRRYERDADQMSVAITAAAGFDPSALSRFLGRLEPPLTSTVSAAFSTYPTTAQRITDINKAIEQFQLKQPDFETIQQESQRAIRE